MLQPHTSDSPSRYKYFHSDVKHFVLLSLICTTRENLEQQTSPAENKRDSEGTQKTETSTSSKQSHIKTDLSSKKFYCRLSPCGTHKTDRFVITLITFILHTTAMLGDRYSRPDSLHTFRGHADAIIGQRSIHGTVCDGVQVRDTFRWVAEGLNGQVEAQVVITGGPYSRAAVVVELSVHVNVNVVVIEEVLLQGGQAAERGSFGSAQSVKHRRKLLYFCFRCSHCFTARHYNITCLLVISET